MTPMSNISNTLIVPSFLCKSPRLVFAAYTGFSTGPNRPAFRPILSPFPTFGLPARSGTARTEKTGPTIPRIVTIGIIVTIRTIPTILTGGTFGLHSISGSNRQMRHCLYILTYGLLAACSPASGLLSLLACYGLACSPAFLWPASGLLWPSLLACC